VDVINKGRPTRSFVYTELVDNSNPHATLGNDWKQVHEFESQFCMCATILYV
jgi:hypothetical protein